MTEVHNVPTTHQKPQDIMSLVNQLEGLGDEYLVKKAPFSLPENVKDIIVKLIFPLAIIEVIFLAFGLFGSVSTFIITLTDINILRLFIPFLSIGMTGLNIGLLLKSIPNLRSQTKQSWHLFYLSILVSCLSMIVSSLVSVFAAAMILPSLVGYLISLFLWFQVKDRYTH